MPESRSTFCAVANPMEILHRAVLQLCPPQITISMLSPCPRLGSYGACFSIDLGFLSSWDWTNAQVPTATPQAPPWEPGFGPKPESEKLKTVQK